MNPSELRNNLLELLEGGIAFVPLKGTLDGLKPENRGVCPGGNLHSVWEELEHMRIAQEDILRYTLDSAWKSPKWPEGYWPDPKRKLMAAVWNSTVKRFFADLAELKSLVKNQKIDLTAEIPHGEGRTYLREVLLAAEHNAYHAGQIVLTRRLLGDWPS
jgi:uncharacterized damage-inducible protein DinB